MKMNVVDALKKMNASYPQCTEDYDAYFMSHLLSSVFSKEDIAACATRSKIVHFMRQKFQFVKST